MFDPAAFLPPVGGSVGDGGAVGEGHGDAAGGRGFVHGEALASGAMRLIKPVSTLPGPTLDEGGDPVGGHALDGGDPVDAARQVLDQLARAPSAVVIGRASELARSGMCGIREGIGARTRAMPSAASAISDEWAAT
jgi:hypothetical protein